MIRPRLQSGVWSQATLTLTLSATSDATFERFEQIPLLEHPSIGDGGWLRCGLPARMAAHDERALARMPALGQIVGRAEIRRDPQDAPARATIKDLSLGGCRLEVPLQTALLWRANDMLDQLSLTDGTGQPAVCRARVCHVRGVENGPNALVGIQFTELAAGAQRRIGRWLRRTENELALRSGHAGRILQECAPFLAAERTAAPRNSPPARERPPLLLALEDIVGHLGTGVIALRHGEPLPIELIEASASRMLELLARDRDSLLYALCCLHDQPQVLAHSIAVAGRLADLLADEPEAVGTPQQRVCAGLVHDLGKFMQAERCLPSQGILDEEAKCRLQRHVSDLIECLPANWLPAAVQRSVIEQVNERLDGSGYPHRVKASALEPIAAAAQVVDVIDAMTRPRGDRHPLSAKAAYRQIYSQPLVFERRWLTRYIQRYGMNPIGSLVEYSEGYLAWVMALNQRGVPNRVRVVRHLPAPGRPMNSVMEGRRIAQFGSLVGAARVEDYGLQPY